MFSSGGTKEEGDSLAEELDKLKVEEGSEKAQGEEETCEKASEDSKEASSEQAKTAAEPESDEKKPPEANEPKSNDTTVTASS